MDPRGRPALTGYSCKVFSPEPTEAIITEERRNKTKYMTSNSMRLEFLKRPACQKPYQVLQLKYHQTY